MTIAEMQAVQRGDILWHKLPGEARKADRVKVTSVRRWQREPERVEIHWQFGLRVYGCFDSLSNDWRAFFHTENPDERR